MLKQFPNLYQELSGDFMQPTTSRERAKMLIYCTIGFLMMYGSTKIPNQVAENGVLLTGALGSVLGVKQLYGATISNYFPDIAKSYAASGVENAGYYGWCVGRSAMNLVNAGVDNTAYLARRTRRSTINVARKAIMLARPDVSSPTL